MEALSCSQKINKLNVVDAIFSIFRPFSPLTWSTLTHELIAFVIIKRPFNIFFISNSDLTIYQIWGDSIIFPSFSELSTRGNKKRTRHVVRMRHPCTQLTQEKRKREKGGKKKEPLTKPSSIRLETIRFSQKGWSLVFKIEIASLSWSILVYYIVGKWEMVQRPTSLISLCAGHASTCQNEDRSLWCHF